MPSKLLNGRGLIGYVAIHRSGFLYFALLSQVAPSLSKPLFSLRFTLSFCLRIEVDMLISILLEYPLA